MVVKQTWRVVLADGTVHDAVIHEDKGEFWARMRPGGIGSCQPTPWAAITRLATAIALDVAEVLAPGEPTRAEFAAAVRAYLTAQDALDANAANIGAFEDRIVARKALDVLVGGAT